MGWILNYLTFCISLLPHKVINIRKDIKEALNLASLLLKEFQKLVGPLQHSAIGILSIKGFFKLLKMALQKISITINISPVSDLPLKLKYWLTLLRDIYQ